MPGSPPSKMQGKGKSEIKTSYNCTLGNDRSGRRLRRAAITPVSSVYPCHQHHRWSLQRSQAYLYPNSERHRNTRSLLACPYYPLPQIPSSWEPLFASSRLPTEVPLLLLRRICVSPSTGPSSQESSPSIPFICYMPFPSSRHQTYSHGYIFLSRCPPTRSGPHFSQERG